MAGMLIKYDEDFLLCSKKIKKVLLIFTLPILLSIFIVSLPTINDDNEFFDELVASQNIICACFYHLSIISNRWRTIELDYDHMYMIIVITSYDYSRATYDYSRDTYLIA